jgi:hypothetical protein
MQLFYIDSERNFCVYFVILKSTKPFYLAITGLKLQIYVLVENLEIIMKPIRSIQNFAVPILEVTYQKL